MQERKHQQAELLRKVRRDFKSKVQAPATPLYKTLEAQYLKREQEASQKKLMVLQQIRKMNAPLDHQQLAAFSK
jgi:hypothetical protein